MYYLQNMTLLWYQVCFLKPAKLFFCIFAIPNILFSLSRENKNSLLRRKFISVVLSYIKLLKLSKTFNVLDLFIFLLDILCLPYGSFTLLLLLRKLKNFCGQKLKRLHWQYWTIFEPLFYSNFNIKERYFYIFERHTWYSVRVFTFSSEGGYWKPLNRILKKMKDLLDKSSMNKVGIEYV